MSPCKLPLCGALVVVLVGGGELGAAPARKAKAAAAASQPAAAEHAEGNYGGVAPGQGERRRGRPPSRPTVTWVGFQPHGEGARVFLQLSTPVTYQQSIVNDEVVVSIPDVALGVRNNARPLDTSFFPTPISRVTVQKRKGPSGVEVHVKFKEASAARQADAHVEQAGDGYQYLYLDFPNRG